MILHKKYYILHWFNMSVTWTQEGDAQFMLLLASTVFS